MRALSYLLAVSAGFWGCVWAMGHPHDVQAGLLALGCAVAAALGLMGETTSG